MQLDPSAFVHSYSYQEYQGNQEKYIKSTFMKKNYPAKCINKVKSQINRNDQQMIRIMPLHLISKMFPREWQKSYHLLT